MSVPLRFKLLWPKVQLRTQKFGVSRRQQTKTAGSRDPAGTSSRGEQQSQRIAAEANEESNTPPTTPTTNEYPSMRAAQESTPLLRGALTGRHLRQKDADDDKSPAPEQRTLSSPNAATLRTPPRAAHRRSQSPSLAVIHEGGPAHERDNSSSFSTGTHDVYENYNTLSAQVVWPPEGMSWPPQQYSLTSSSSSSSSCDAFDIEDAEDMLYRAPSRSSKQIRQIQLLIICTAMVSIPMVAFVSIMQSKEYFDLPLNNNNGKGGNRRKGVQHSHRHFHRSIEKSLLANNVNYTMASSDDVFDVSTIPVNISFGELASIMVPTYFQTTVDICIATIDRNSNNTIDVMPDDVFVLRKTILKTRDVLDVFAPVYPRKLRLLGHEKKDTKKDKQKKGKKGEGKHRSQSEQVLHKMRKNHHSVVDVWKILRKFLDDGYMLIGDFQDLSHAKVKYTPERLHNYQGQVLNWKEEFVGFVAQNHDGILDYLSHACPEKTETQAPQLSLANIKASQSHRVERGKKRNIPKCSYSRSKSSHLFWNDTPSSKLPDGNIDPASSVLAQLGSAQLNRALVYLSQALAAEHVVGDQAVNKDVHELYHNLRKEIRSFLDSADLFGRLLFPDKSFDQHYEDISLLKKTKKLLGDLNDEVVAYSKYLEWNEYPEEQLQLKSYITSDWGDFRRWAQEVDLSDKLYSLADAMANVQNEERLQPSTTAKSIDSFLKERKNNPTRSFVIGNDAGDADSIISAICLAFIEGKTPIVSISRDSLVERPEVEMLLDLAGVSNASANMLFIEDLKMILDSSKDSKDWELSLVDHNTINHSLHKFRHLFQVVEIVDHHTDEHLYTDTCTRRNVAFANEQALVASTATLVAELLLKQTSTPPVSISTLLLGVILLDSVNLDESIGKVTPRDRDAVSKLLSLTDWNSNSLLPYLKPSDGESQPTIDTNQLFIQLERSKYGEHWESFDVTRALGYDYKAFNYGRRNATQRFGISTILMPGQQFMEKEGFFAKTAEFMRSKEIEFLGIMLTFYDKKTGKFRRQLAFCLSRHRWREIEDDFLKNQMYADLALSEIRTHPLSSDEIDVHLYEQENVTPSRKQIGPMLVKFFEQEHANERDIKATIFTWNRWP